MAKRHLCKESADQILQMTARINEAYLRMIEWKDLKWENRAHFSGLAAHDRAENFLRQPPGEAAA
jgi:hypothetical protein